MQVSEAFTVSA